MKVLVTGASGFIGFHCCNQLSALGYEVHAVSSKFHVDNSIQWHKADLLDSQQTKELINKVKPTHLLHLAWYAEHGKYWTSIKNYHWVKASLTLFEEFNKSGGTRVVVSGTCAEYDLRFSKYYEDSTPLNPNNLYGVCKHSLQSMLSSYASLTGLSFAWGRIFSIYGPREHPKRLFASVIQALLRGETVKCNNGELTRDYLHVNDVASALIALLSSDVQGPINIGSGSGETLRTIVQKIEKNIGNYGYLRLNKQSNITNEPPIIIANTNRLDNIGWAPIYNIDRGLENTIEWFKKN